MIMTGFGRAPAIPNEVQKEGVCQKAVFSPKRIEIAPFYQLGSGLNIGKSIPMVQSTRANRSERLADMNDNELLQKSLSYSKKESTRRNCSKF